MKDFAIWESGKKVLIMVKEYIERGHAVDAVLDVYCDTPDIDLSCEKFEAAILKIPAADVAPVRHGRWLTWEEQFPAHIPSKKSGLGVFCSTCHKHADNMYDYCPNCGAKMDGEEKR